MLRPTFSAQALHVALATVEELGVDREKVLRRLGLQAPYEQHPNERLPIAVGVRFWQACDELSRDPLIGLKAGLSVGFGKYPLLDFLCASAKTVGEGLALFSRYVAIVNDVISPRVTERRDHIEVSIVRRLQFIPLRTADEFHLALLLNRLRALTELAQDDCLVTFAHASGADPRQYEELLQAQVKFRSRRNAVVIRAPGYLARTISSRPHRLKTDITALVERVLSTMFETQRTEGNPLLTQLHQALKETCPSGTMNVDQVGRKMAMSGRTLQRRLAQLDTCFDDELGIYRKYTSISLLQIGVSIDEIAFLLGYRHSTNFIRAFKDWYGVAPARWSKYEVG